MHELPDQVGGCRFGISGSSALFKFEFTFEVGNMSKIMRNLVSMFESFKKASSTSKKKRRYRY